jgi:hypothetical protein
MKSESIISLAICSITFVILLWQLVKATLQLTAQKARIVLFLNLLLCLTRNLTFLIQMTIPGVNCKALAMSGFTIYALWIVVLDTLLLIRAQAFSSHPKVLTVVSFTLMALFFGLHSWEVATIKPISAPSELCVFIAQFEISNYTLITRTALEVWILVPFVSKAYQSYRLLGMPV